MALRAFGSIRPVVPPSCYVDESSQLVGNVTLGEGSTVWLNTVIRGDVNFIRIGARTNIQDLSLLHVHGGSHPTVIGDDVTVGHHVVLHGCTVGNRVLVGMGAIVLDGCVIEDDCLIGAGALLTPGMRVPAGSLVLGSPGKVKRPLSEEEKASLLASSARYVALGQTYRESVGA